MPLLGSAGGIGFMPNTTPPSESEQPQPQEDDAATPFRPRRRLIVATGAVLAAAVAGGAVGSVATSALGSESAVTTTVVGQQAAAPAETEAQAEPEATSSDGDLSVSEVYREVADGVVEITARGIAGDGSSPFGQQQSQAGTGSGFVYGDQGHVVTNYHVVEGAQSVEVTLADGNSYDARVVGSDPSTDLAVLEVDAPQDILKPLAIGDSDSLEVGEQVVAVGSPFGLEETVTTGIVSALDRRITAPDGFAIDDAIQTDAAINHGNSGGPLVNMRGEVVGVNSQIQSESGGNVGIGFAIPSNTVRSIVSQLLTSGQVEHAFLGVGVETIPAEVAEQLGEAPGAAVARVTEGSPAADAGLRAATDSRAIDGVPYPTGGDVITAVDGTKVSTSEELQDAIADHGSGDQIELTVVRDGQTRSVEVTLGSRPTS
jgi:S1-C subfamily serine protease